MKFLKTYFYDNDHQTLKFIIDSSIIAIIGKFSIGLLIGIVITASNISSGRFLTTGSPDKTNPLYLFLWVCIIAPFIETIIFQFFPITLLQKIDVNNRLIVGIDTIFFASLHWYQSLISAITILPLALVLSWGFVKYMKESVLKAIWITVAIHIIFNITTYLFMVFV